MILKVRTLALLIFVLLLLGGCAVQHIGMHITEPGTAPDADLDTVPDDRDRCPDTPLGVTADRWGCSGNSCAPMCDGLPTLSGVHFEYDSDTLRPEAYPLLNRAVEVLKAYPESRIDIVGHTDNQGSGHYNLELSQRRAQSVVNYMVSYGIDAQRLRALGKGEDYAVASNSTEAGRAQNRRVEFLVPR